MIVAEFFRKNGEITGFKVSGHAGYDMFGKDIVCAGVSALTQSALLGLDRCAKRRFDLDIASGKLTMDLEGKPDTLTQAILETMFLGLVEIAGNYPKSVRVEEHRR